MPFLKSKTDLCALEKKLKEISTQEKFLDKPTFFLFEENPYWYAQAHEVLRKAPEGIVFNVILFGNSMPKPTDGAFAYMKRFKGGIWKNGNILKYLTRRFIPQLIQNRKPSSVLIESLKQTDHNIIDFRKKIIFKNHTIFSFQNFDGFETNLWRNFTHCFIGEIHGTEFIEQYKSKELVEDYYQSVRGMYGLVNLIFKRLQPQIVHYINGRTFYERVVYEIAEKTGIKSVAYESNTRDDRYMPYQGAVTNFNFIEQAVEQFWKETVSRIGLVEATEKATKFYVERQESVNFNPFISKLSREFPKLEFEDFKVYSFFTTSSDEFNAVYNQYRLVPPDQKSILQDLIKVFENETIPNSKLIIRVHPNMSNKRPLDRKFYEDLEVSRNVIIYGSDSGMNSYEIVQYSDYVLTLASTVGLEAAFMRKPTFCFGKPYWSKLGVSHEVERVDEIFSSKPIDLELAFLQSLKVGLFYSDYGSRYEFTDMVRLQDIHGKYSFDPIWWILGKMLKIFWPSQAKVKAPN